MSYLLPRAPVKAHRFKLHIFFTEMQKRQMAEKGSVLIKKRYHMIFIDMKRAFYCSYSQNRSLKQKIYIGWV